MKTNKIFIRAEGLSFWENKNFYYEKLALTVEEEKEEMHNLILFQTVTNSDGEFVSQPHKKLKNKENFIREHKFNFDKIKTFTVKNSSSD